MQVMSTSKFVSRDWSLLALFRAENLDPSTFRVKLSVVIDENAELRSDFTSEN